MKNLLILFLTLFLSMAASAQVSMHPRLDGGTTYTDSTHAEILVNVMYKSLSGIPVTVAVVGGCDCMEITHTNYPDIVGFISIILTKPIGNYYHYLDCIFTDAENRQEILPLIIIGDIKQTSNPR